MDLTNIDLTWAPPVLAFLSVLGVLAGVIRWLVKHYFDEIKAELKPNGGGSIKDQVNRLEKQHNLLDQKVDRIMEILVTGRFQRPDTEIVETIVDQSNDSKNSK
jgi:hypothetical protein